MTEGQMLFVLLIILGALAIFGIVSCAMSSHEDRRRLRRTRPGKDLPLR